MKIGLIGLDYIGNAIQKSFQKRKINCTVYDKEKQIGILEDCLLTDIIFLCLPFVVNSDEKVYDKNVFFELCTYFSENKYKGSVVIKSSLEPMTTESFATMFPKLSLIHNPVFLSKSTPYHDFHNQKHIVIGSASTCPEEDKTKLQAFYQRYYPQAKISHCHSTESESMKYFCESFYAVKLHFFSELQHLCKKINCKYENIRKLMLKNYWIHPTYTNPSEKCCQNFRNFIASSDKPNGQKKNNNSIENSPENDLSVVVSFMKKNSTNHKLLSAITECSPKVK